MPPEKPSLYSISKTTKWFAIVSVLMMISLVWLILKDHQREWKKYQREFVEMKVDKAQVALKSAEQQINQRELEELEAELKQAEQTFKSRESEYAALEKEIKEIELKEGISRNDVATKKQFRDSFRYYYEINHEHGKAEADEYYQKFLDMSKQVEVAEVVLEKYEIELEVKKAKASSYLSKKKEIQSKINKLLADKNRIEKAITAIKPGLVTEILNAPMVDFSAPTLVVQQVVLEDLYDDLYYAKAQKVDRCMTCHLGIDQKGFEDAPQPFKTHPKLDLFLDANSPHPLEKIGCTVCHSGSGHSVDFTTAAHTPQNEKQEKEWKEKYGWHRMEKWALPMLPLQHTEASCVKCHKDVLRVPQADKLNQGRELMEKSGCYGCHNVQEYDNHWNTGPSLENVKSKLDSEWINRWLQNPKRFRKSTNMPRFFNLSNTDEPEDLEKAHTEIEGIITYLMSHSKEVTLEKLPVEGDPNKGEALVEQLGCMGCHTVGDVAVANHGPELNGLGSKVKPEWLFDWLKNPKHYNPDTRMPSLRLSDQEAADITAYLLSKRNTDFDNLEIPKVKPAVLDELVAHYLEKTMHKVDAKEKLVTMSAENKLEYLGEKTISFRGCYACHTIKGFESAKQIGADLSDHARKDLHKFDFGLQHKIEHTSVDWFYNKMKNPQVYDEGKEVAYFERLRMPNFDFTEDEVESMVTFLLSQNKEYVPLEMQKLLTLHENVIEQGRFLVEKYNCQGCHTLDGKEGAIRKLYEGDEGNAPPILEGEGAKVQEKWVHGFMKEVVPIRPWLNVRMPSFGFDDESAGTLVKYFTYLSNQEVSYMGADIPAATEEELEAGEMLFNAFRCVQCHKVDQKSASLGASFLAPDLALSKHRLKADWVLDWLLDPNSVQEGTMMPGFWPDGQSPLEDVLNGDAKAQIKAVRDYLYRWAPQPEVVSAAKKADSTDIKVDEKSATEKKAV